MFGGVRCLVGSVFSAGSVFSGVRCLVGNMFSRFGASVRFGV